MASTASLILFARGADCVSLSCVCLRLVVAAGQEDATSVDPLDLLALETGYVTFD